MNPSDREDGRVAAGREELAAAARKRAAVETYARHEGALRRTARRFSLCEDDADDALQRGLEIMLRKAPTDDPRELIRWTQTVVRHEALAVRRERERILAGPAARPAGEEGEDWVTLIPAAADGPAERAERREAIARSREALRALKPAELRALTLLAQGYSYREIGEITGFSPTKINRCLAEGRERFRRFLARSGDGERCAELQPLLSAYCDGETGEEDASTVREHLRACGQCRATLRAYRAAPGAAAALAPALPAGRPLLERVHDALAGMAARFTGGGGGTDAALSQVAAAGGARGAGMAALAKVLAVCVGTVGGAAACVATGVVPTPLVVEEEPSAAKPSIERPAPEPTVEAPPEEAAAPPPEATEPAVVEAKPEPPRETTAAAPPPTPESSAGAVEYTPPPAPVSAAPSAPSASSPSAGSAAGEFGP